MLHFRGQTPACDWSTTGNAESLDFAMTTGYVDCRCLGICGRRHRGSSASRCCVACYGGECDITPVTNASMYRCMYTSASMRPEHRVSSPAAGKTSCLKGKRSSVGFLPFPPPPPLAALRRLGPGSKALLSRLQVPVEIPSRALSASLNMLHGKRKNFAMSCETITFAACSSCCTEYGYCMLDLVPLLHWSHAQNIQAHSRSGPYVCSHICTCPVERSPLSTSAQSVTFKSKT